MQGAGPFGGADEIDHFRVAAGWDRRGGCERRKRCVDAGLLDIAPEIRVRIEAGQRGR